MTRIVTVGAAQMGPINRNHSRGQVVQRLLDLTRSCKTAIFNFEQRCQPDAYRMIVERKGALPPP